MRVLLLLSSALVCRAQWVNICTNSDGNECCANTGMKDHTYFITTSPRSWEDLNTECQLKDPNSRLVVFESQREVDCLVKYLSDKYQGKGVLEYAIGLKIQNEDYKVYEWEKVYPSSTQNYDSATPTFHNWASASPTGLGCVSMSVGDTNPTNGLWKDVDCTTGLLHGICEKQVCAGGECAVDTPITCDCTCPAVVAADPAHPMCPQA